MVNKFTVEGFDSFIEKAEALKSTGKPTYVLFSGSKDPATGKSWCPDCVVADPVINSVLDKLESEDVNFLYVSVGPRTFWKDQSNPFRTDLRTKLKSVPTLFKYGSSKRLEESQCSNQDLVEMLFED
ncbi:UNVERIFIED_CONTAM: hypothetical protein RMT77_011190 [Armadillidium vulgare]|nr:Thioredoxin domain-containing protein 17 [Armadillidium vulgare]